MKRTDFCGTAFLLLLAAIGLAGLAAAGDRWPDERSAGLFTCHADFSLRNHAALLDDLGRLQQDLAETLGMGGPQEAIAMYFFAEERAYRNYVKHYFPDAEYRQAMYIKQRGPGMVFAHLGSQFEVHVRHESTHALLHAALPMVPLWLDEGMAEYFQVAPSERAFDNPHLAAVRWSARFGAVRRIESLEKVSDLSRMGRAEYRQSWAWVHFMLHGPPEAHDELVRYLADIAAHTPPGQLGQRLRRRIPDLDRRIVEHFNAWKR